MRQLRLKCTSAPSDETIVQAFRDGRFKLKSNVHSREQAIELRDWLDEYLARPTEEEIEMAEALREVWLGDIPADPYSEWSEMNRCDWLRVARAAMKRGAK
jgi:hypothetical protein